MAPVSYAPVPAPANGDAHARGRTTSRPSHTGHTNGHTHNGTGTTTGNANGNGRTPSSSLGLGGVPRHSGNGAPHPHSHPIPHVLSPTTSLHNGGNANPSAGHRSVTTTPRATALDDITRRVRAQSDRFQRALAPVADDVRVFAEENPVSFTFIAIFAVLSIIPVLCFLGFVIGTALFLTGTAVFVLFGCLTFAVVFGLAVLVPVLCFTCAVSAFFLGVLLALFLAHRLVLHISAASTDRSILAAITEGVRTWLLETRARVFGDQPTAFEVDSFTNSAATTKDNADAKEEDKERDAKPAIKYEHEDRLPDPSNDAHTKSSDSDDVFSAESTPNARDALAVRRLLDDMADTDAPKAHDAKNRSHLLDDLDGHFQTFPGARRASGEADGDWESENGSDDGR